MGKLTQKTKQTTQIAKKNGKSLKTTKPNQKKLSAIKQNTFKNPKTDTPHEKEGIKGFKRKSQDGEPTTYKKHKPDFKKEKPFKFSKSNHKGQTPQHNTIGNGSDEKPNWVKVKQEKKDLKVKRKQTNNLYELTIEAKKLWETLRRKSLKGGEEERKNLAEKLHNLEKGNYSKLVLSHDMARVVQHLLKHSSEEIRQSISQELIPSTVEMLQSKYGRYCVKRMLKYGNSNTRTSILTSCYGNAVKLVSHSVSAPVFEFAYNTYATPEQKHHLLQEFYGDIYKNSKDKTIKHLKDVYEKSPALKTATLSATKANLSRILDKNLLDSELAQTLLYQYLSECDEKDRNEMINQLLTHCAVLSNSKDGARAVRLCLSKGTNKDRKTIIKALKDHILDLSKHEQGHSVIITLLDITDDTILLKKAIIPPLIENCRDLIVNEWGRKVLLWLVAPADKKHFHPVFLAELDEYRKSSTSKKSVEVRREEILTNVSPSLLEHISNDSNFWFSTPSIALVTLAILTSGSGEKLKSALEGLIQLIVNPEWKIKENEQEIVGIEHSGFHMVLKKLAKQVVTFGETLVPALTPEILSTWIQVNRGCFLLLFVLENGDESTVSNLKEKLTPYLKKIKKEKTFGAKLLWKKISV